MFKYSCCLIALLVMTITAASQTPPANTARERFESGIALLNAKKFPEALAAFRESVRLDSKQPAAHANMGAVLVLSGKPAEAVPSYREAARLAPNDGSFRTGLCKALVLIKSFSEAVTECEEGVRLAPDSHYARAALIETMNRARLGASDIQRVVDLAMVRFPDDESIIVEAASFYVSIGNPAAAADLYQRLITLKPGSAVYHAYLAEVYMLLERDNDAVSEARKALELEPKNARAQYFMGRLFFELGQHSEASQAFETVTQSTTDFPDAPYYFALSEARRGRNESAVAALRRLVAIDPDNFDYQSELGRSLNGIARYEEAIDPMQKAVRLKPKDVEAKAGLGLALFESGRLSEAIAILEEADRTQPGNEVVTMFLRVARSRQQAMPQIPEMKEFAKENPQDAGVRMNLVNLLAFSRRIIEAEPYIAEIYKIGPKDVRFYQGIAVAYATAGLYDKAITAYAKSFEIEESPGAYLGLAGIYQKAGRVDDASRAYAKVLELKPDSPNIAKIYADHLLDNGKRREALEMYKRALASLPFNAPALFNAAVLSAKFGDLETARRYLEPLKTADPSLARTLERILRLKLWQ